MQELLNLLRGKEFLKIFGRTLDAYRMVLQFESAPAVRKIGLEQLTQLDYGRWAERASEEEENIRYARAGQNTPGDAPGSKADVCIAKSLR